MEWVNKIHTRNTLEILKQMPDDFVDMSITSPPYWNLRDYGDETETIWGGDKECKHDWDKYVRPNFCSKCGAWKGQLGLEPHPNMFINNLVEIFRELKRVLKKTGSFYLNIGDTYYATSAVTKDKWKHKKSIGTPEKSNYVYDEKWLQPKQLMLIPSRLAIAMQEDGWILRNDIIWHKPNPMPTSVKDRLNNTYEHVFHFVKSRKYYYNLDAIRIPHKTATFERAKHAFNKTGASIHSAVKETGQKKFAENLLSGKLSGKNPGDFWLINTKPCPKAHFAVFPKELVEGPIKSSCPLYICKKCGKPREHIIDTVGHRTPEEEKKLKELMAKRGIPRQSAGIMVPSHSKKIDKGWTDCGCNAGFEPGIVLDPFCGTGTTCRIAKSFGRRYIGIDINPTYVEEFAKEELGHGSVREWF